MCKLTHLSKEILRLLARNSPGNGLRIFLFGLSGIKMGHKVYVNQGLVIVDDSKRNMIVLEDYVTLAPNVILVTISSPNYIHPELRDRKLPCREGKIIIREGAWIGAGVIILPGITVGECSIVGAGSVVTRDVPAFTIVAGSPAKVIREIERIAHES